MGSYLSHQAVVVTPHQKAADITEPFRFLDLPSEIRNKIYKILLCNFDTPPRSREDSSALQIGKVEHDIQLQILRTCRKVYYEGTSLMHRTNLFIKLEIDFDIYEMPELLRIPFVTLWKFGTYNYFESKGTVMTHKLSSRRSPDIPGYCTTSARMFTRIILLHFHLPELCKALSSAQWRVLNDDEDTIHTVTLTDPNQSEASQELPEFFSRKLQEELLAPYRSEMKGFPHFILNGIIPDDLRIETVSAITHIPEVYDASEIQASLDDKEYYHQHGLQHYRQGEIGEAKRSWKICVAKIQKESASERGARLRQSGGPKFMNAIAKIYFHLALRISHVNILKMQTHYLGHTALLADAVSYVHQLGHDLRTWQHTFRDEFTWRPSPLQQATLLYQEALCYRLSNHRAYLIQAYLKIFEALQIVPHEEKFLAEEKSIAAAIWESRSYRIAVAS
ncbi:hypothetical protein NHQ30_004407 [Ciborinia camelliae]|nr:hypothetical protein NHQ30_004407 [Ciborinia camelliae]